MSSNTTIVRDRDLDKLASGLYAAHDRFVMAFDHLPQSEILQSPGGRGALAVLAEVEEYLERAAGIAEELSGALAMMRALRGGRPGAVSVAADSDSRGRTPPVVWRVSLARGRRSARAARGGGR